MDQTLKITVLTGVSTGDVFKFSLGKDKRVTIGRAEGNDLVLGDPMVSRNHAAIEFEKGEFHIIDLDSSHGTLHMGFRLKPGKDGARRLADGDEFKIGEALFRVNFDRTALAGEGEENKAAAVGKASNWDTLMAPQLKGNRCRRTVLLSLAVILVLVLVLLILPDSRKKPSLPPQLSNLLLELPQHRLIGYWPASGKVPAKEKDSQHLDMAQFALPVSDLLVEYKVMGETPIGVLVDGVNIGVIPPQAEETHWQYREMVIRDVLGGAKRKLVFDNTSFPLPGKDKAIPTSHKRWAVYGVRAAPLSRVLDETMDKALDKAVAVADGLKTSPSGLFLLTRALHYCILEQLVEINRDAVDFPVFVGEEIAGGRADEVKAKEVLQAIRHERQIGVSLEASERHLDALMTLVGDFEGQLWLRVNGRFKQAEFASRAKNYIVAYDSLVGVKAMFPDEADYRWLKAERMLNDNAFVPPRVRKNPGSYRQ